MKLVSEKVLPESSQPTKEALGCLRLGAPDPSACRARRVPWAPGSREEPWRGGKASPGGPGVEALATDAGISQLIKVVQKTKFLNELQT